jgi:uridine kinase
VSAPRDAVLIVDGIFLHRPELRDLWDWSVWLEVPWDVAYARMALRDGSDPDPDAPSNARYREGQELYLDEADPKAAASVIIDNADLAHPHRMTRNPR